MRENVQYLRSSRQFHFDACACVCVCLYVYMCVHSLDIKYIYEKVPDAPYILCGGLDTTIITQQQRQQ